MVVHQVLISERGIDPEELKNYGIQDGDFFSMRERDEDEDNISFTENA